MGRPTTIGELFDEAPRPWGLRGDPHLWWEMQAQFASTPLPAHTAELRQQIALAFEQLSGQPISTLEPFYVEKFAHGGMSSGYISLEFWREKALPLLLSRHALAQPVLAERPSHDAQRKAAEARAGNEGARMRLVTEAYAEQVKAWLKEGRHILAQFDDDTIIVYQAYCPAIGRFAVENGVFGGDFQYGRMSWVKPNFLWMMYRSGWGTKKNQEVTLALRLRREFFDALLAEAVSSSWDGDRFASREEWSRAVNGSSVRLQWDPDHHPSGAKLERRAIQLGLRGEVLEAFGRRELLEVIDLSEFVAEQRARLALGGTPTLITPRERVYRPADPEIATKLGLGEYAE